MEQWWVITLYISVWGDLQTEHRDMQSGDSILHTDDNGHEYLTFNKRQTNENAGGGGRDIHVVKDKQWANFDNLQWCMVLT